VLLFTEEVISNNTDILALIFHHHYSSRKGKGLTITCHEGTERERGGIALPIRNIGHDSAALPPVPIVH
jgi:hypothetical protein